MPQPTISLAPSLTHVTPSRIRELADVAFAMQGALKLQFGESTMPTPAYIVDAAIQAMNDGHTFYSENAGIPPLRAAIAEQVDYLHQVTIAPSEVLVTASGVQALNVAIRCVVDPGDAALILSPNWPNATEIVRLIGATPTEIPLLATGDRFEIDFAGLEAAVTPKTRLLVYTSPSNPLGWVATLADQQALLDFCRRHQLWLLADEVYERIYYGGPVAPSILRLCTRNDAVIVTQSFSKSYRMTGWRLGWVVARADLVAKASQLNEFIVSHAATMIQRAGIAALQQGEEDVCAMVEVLQERQAFCADALLAMPRVSLPKPEGAFYLFPRIEGVDDSFQFALDLLKTTQVAVAPGVAFGNGGEGSIRICYAPDMSVLEPAMARLHDFLARE